MGTGSRKRNLLLVATIISLSAAMIMQTPVKADTLAEAIANEATPSYTMEDNYTGALGSLTGSDRIFIIYGANHTISGDNTYTGIEVASGQTLGLDNVTFSNIKTYDVQNAGTMDLSGNNTIKTITGTTGTTNITGGTTELVRYGSISQNGINLKGGRFVINKDTEVDAEIKADINNHVDYVVANSALGGVLNIGNTTIPKISGAFKGNTFTSGETARGGVIYNGSTINSLTAGFTDNSMIATSEGFGGAVYNLGTIKSISGDFTDNTNGKTADQYTNAHRGGAIYNISNGVIGTKTGEEFVGSAISGTFSGNIAGLGGAIFNGYDYYDPNAEIGNITSNFTNNKALAGQGGAIFNGRKIASISGTYTNNTASNTNEAFGGAIYTTGTITNGINNSIFRGNSVISTNNNAHGGAIYHKGGTLNISNSTFGGTEAGQGNSSSGIYAYGGAIYTESGTLNVVDSSFIGNIAKDGAAIYGYNGANVTVYAKNKNVEFTNNNTTGTADGTGYGIEIFNNGSLNLNADAGRKLTVNDSILSTTGMSINAGGTHTGTVALNKALALGDEGLTLSGGTLKLNNTAALSIVNTNLKLNGGTFDIVNGAIDDLTFANAINNTANSSLVLDASIGDTNTADKITSDISGTSTIFISGVNFISDNKNGGEVQIADGNIKSVIAISDVAGGYADVQYNNSTGVLSFADKIDWLQQTNGANSGYRFTKTNNGIMPVNYTSGENNYTFYTDILKKNYTDDNGIAHDLKYTWDNTTHTLSVTNSDDTALSTTKSTIVRIGDGSAAAPFVYTGDHVGNTAIGLNRWNTFGDITGDFVGNTNGAIAMGMGVNIPSITGNFIGNSGGRAFSFSGDHSWGSSVSSITGDFIGNSNGAIYIFNWNNGGIGAVTGDFIGNKADDGGAILLADSHINSVIGNFVNNYAVNNGGALYVGDGKNGANISVTGDFIANQAVTRGGAVYNGNGATTKLIDSSFIGNIAPEGAAIYVNKGELTVTALNKDIEFTNNNSTGLAGGDGYGIYHKSSGYRPFAINAYEGRTITVNDKVYSEQKINLNCYYSGDWVGKNGTVIFNNEFTQTGATEISSNESNAGGGTVIFNGTTSLADLDVSGTATLKLGAGAGTSTFGAVTFSRSPILDIANDSAQTLTVASIKNNAKLNIDLDFTGDSVLADAINITTGGKTGVLTINDINVITSDTGAIRTFSDLEILKGETDGVTLALSEAIQTDERFNGSEVETITRVEGNYTDNATFGQFNEDKFTGKTYAVKTSNKLYLDDTKTKLSFNSVSTDEYLKSETAQDVLQALNQSTNAERSLTATDTNKNYTVGADLGTTGTGSLTVQGVTGSNLNMNNKSGFELSNADTTLTLSNLDITNVKDLEGGFIIITGENSQANLENVTITPTTNSAILNDKTLNLSGTNSLGTGLTGENGTTNITDGKTTVDSLVQKAVNITSGELEVSNVTTTDGISNAGTLTLTGGNIASNVSGSGKTIIDGTDVSVKYGNSIAQDMVINSGKKLINTNVASIGGAVENNGDIQLYSQDNGKLEQDITGTGTTELNRDITIAANVENTINIKSYIDTEGTHNANITVESGSNLGKTGQNITVDSNNSLIMQNAGDIKGNLIDNGTVELQGGTLSNAISGTGDVNITGDIINNTTNTVTGTVSVAAGKELSIGTSGDTFNTANAVIMGNGSVLNIQNNSTTNAVMDNLVIAAGETVNIKMDWKDTLNSSSNNVNGNLLLTDINLSSTTGAEDTYTFTNLGNKVSLKEPLTLSGVTSSTNNFVTYDNTNGDLTSYRSSLVRAVDTTGTGLTATYVMTTDETAGGEELDGTLKVQGDGHTIITAGIKVGSSSITGADLILENTNINVAGKALEIYGGSKATVDAAEHDITLTTTDSSEVISLNTSSGAYANAEFKGANTITINGDIKSDDVNNTLTIASGSTVNHAGLLDPITTNVSGTYNRTSGYDETVTYNVNASGQLNFTNDATLYDAGHHTTATLNTINFNGGSVNTVNGVVTDFQLANMSLTGSSNNFYADVDLANQTMDKFTVANPVTGSGKLNIAGMNLISDAKKVNTSINFTKDPVLMAAVNYTGSQGLTALSPIYKYNVEYNNSNGNFDFTRYGGKDGGKPSYNDLNPAIMAAPVAAQLGGYFTQLNSYDEAFRNMDMYMLMTAQQRQALKNKNKIASLDGGVLYDATLMRQERAEGWFRPFASFEKVGLKNGPKVENISYGSFMGGESEMYDLGHGWDGMWGAYVGYNGSHQNYDGVSIYQNGGTLGILGMAYKGNFFTGLTLNAGANGVEANTIFGNEDFAMLMAGVASKTGYNWELLNGKFIIQPSMLMSYSFVNTFDYRNGAGIKIDSDPLHAIQLQPELKFIGNLKNGWQPYASVAMIWNIMDDTKFKANDVSLPELSVKPYVKYGVGVRKTWGERLTGFFQTYITNGGRNGVGLQAGFTWAFGGGKDKKADDQKIQKSLNKTPRLKKTEIVLKGHKVQ